MRAGTRFQQIAIDVKPAAGLPVRRDLSDFNHDLSALREIGRDQASLRFSRSLQRFDPSDLNPEVVVIDPRTLSVGNPYLLPQRVTNIEAEYAIDRGTLTGGFTIYHRRTDDIVSNFTQILAGDAVLTSKRNGVRSLSTGAQITIAGKIGSDLKFSVSGNAYHARFSGFDGGKSALLTGSLQGSLDLEATSQDSLHLDASAQGPSVLPFGYRTGTAGVNAVWRHSFSAKWSASLTVRGLVQNGTTRTVVTTANGRSESIRYNGTRALYLGVSKQIR